MHFCNSTALIVGWGRGAGYTVKVSFAGQMIFGYMRFLVTCIFCTFYHNLCISAVNFLLFHYMHLVSQSVFFFL